MTSNKTRNLYNKTELNDKKYSNKTKFINLPKSSLIYFYLTTLFWNYKCNLYFINYYKHIEQNIETLFMNHFKKDYDIFISKK